jgi:hypothetical protein
MAVIAKLSLMALVAFCVLSATASRVPSEDSAPSGVNLVHGISANKFIELEVSPVRRHE